MKGEPDSSDLPIVKEFLRNLLPFLTRDLCGGCAATLASRIKLLNPVNEQNPGELDGEEIGRGVKEPNLGSVEVVLEVADGFDGCFGTHTDGLEHIRAAGWDADPVSERSPGDSEEEEIDRRAEKPNFGSVEVASEVAGGFDGYFRTDTDGLEHIKATGWDTDPESVQSPRDKEEEEIGSGVDDSKLGSMQVASEFTGGFDGYFRASPCGLEYIKATGWETDPESERSPHDREEKEIGSGVEEPKLGSMEVASEVPGWFDGYFRSSSCGLEHIKATGWDTDPEIELSPGDPDEEKVDRNMEESNLGSVEVPSNAADRFDGYFRASPERREHIKATGWDADPAPELPKVRMSWADMVQQDQLEEEEKEKMRGNSLEIGIEGEKEEVFREQRECIGFSRLGRKKDFVCLERIDGRIVNILEGLELHTGVFSVLEQEQIVNFVYELQEKGRNNGLGEHAYSEESESRTHMRARGHAAIQFGCCYNYMEHTGIPPGIIHGVVADPMPNLFNIMIKRLISWHVMPASCIPDSCRVNIYGPGDFEPPNIDRHDFVRPFCTVSFLNEGSINFGSNLKDNDAGEFTGSTAIPLPVGSVLVFNGKGANVAKHCVAAVPSKRISITFRKMEKPDLQNIRPHDLGADAASNGRTNDEGGSFVGIRNGAKIPQNSKKVGGSAPERLTPNHSRIERSRDCGALLRDHRGGRDESEELPRRFQLDLKNDDGGKNCRGRSVRMEERRIIITRNLQNDDARSRRPRAARPQIHIQTYNNSRRRVRLIQ